jgi:hypothetical protein
MPLSQINSASIENGSVTPTDLAQPLTSGTAQASTSGTSIDFTSIPSWVKRITVMLNSISLNGTSNILIQIGSGSPTTTGYISASSLVGQAVATQGVTSTAGFIIIDGAASQNIIGSLTIVNISGNTWIASGIFIINGIAYTGQLTGGVSLSGVLDRVRITTVNGTDAFDAGSINILYE